MKEYIIPLISVRRGSIVTLNVDAIVNPTNSFGFMGGGVSKVIKQMGGEVIEEEAIAQAPIQIGDAVVTSPGVLACKKVIHAPITHNPGERINEDSVVAAVEAALNLADGEGMKVLAMPGVGCGDGGIDESICAKLIVDTIKATKFVHLSSIILVAKDESLALEFENQINLHKKK